MVGDGRFVYGVPRGGCVVAALVGIPVDVPAAAEIIVDDLIDSGHTRAAYLNTRPKAEFHALFDKSPGAADEAEGWLVFPWEGGEAGSIEDSVVRQIQYVGEQPAREGLVDTPSRVARALRENTAGYQEKPAEILSTVFEEAYDEMIVVKDIEFWSLCEHHLLPFHGQATVGYIPDGKVVGLSKIARLVHCFARRLQVQERMTEQIAQALVEHLKPTGAGCLVSAHHTCMAMRGVRASAPMLTSALYGAMREGARDEFLRLAGR
jgi:GTP cyclohydrolase I